MSDETSENEDRGPLVKLTNCGNNQEASALRGLLEANGIYSYVQGEQHRSMLGDWGPYIELNVLVGQHDLAEAQAILDEHEAVGEPERSGLTSEGVAGPVPLHVSLEGGPAVEGDVPLDVEAHEGADYRDERAKKRRFKIWVLLWLFFLGPGIALLIMKLLDP